MTAASESALAETRTRGGISDQGRALELRFAALTDPEHRTWEPARSTIDAAVAAWDDHAQAIIDTLDREG